jgi:hypothetical protein
MAFTILVDGKTPEGEEAAIEFNWKLEQEKPYPDGQPWYFVASGAELKHIITTFQNVPYKIGATSCTWYDEWAKFLYNNL